MRGIASPLPPRRIHPRHKWRGILRGSHKKKSLNKVQLNMANAEKSKNNMVLKKLNQEKGTFDRDIRKLERQLIMGEKSSY
jgi:hypothetical protein